MKESIAQVFLTPGEYTAQIIIQHYRIVISGDRVLKAETIKFLGLKLFKIHVIRKLYRWNRVMYELVPRGVVFELTNEILEITYTNSAARRLQLLIFLLVLLVVDAVVLAVGVLAVYIRVAAFGQRLAQGVLVQKIPAA